MLRRILDHVWRNGPETSLSVGLVLAFFMIFLVLLSMAFPEGTSLKNVMRDTRITDLVRERSGGDVDIDLGQNSLVAQLSYIHRKVKHKPADYLSWADSHPGMYLEDRHSVQTLTEARATIAFDERNAMDMGPNTLVVVKDLNHERKKTERRAELVVLGGELSGRLEAGPDDSAPVDVVTASASRLQLRGREGDPASFSVVVNDDGSSTFSVYEGSAEVSSEGGSVLVTANQTVTVAANQRPGRPERLPSSPTLTGPVGDVQYYFRSQPPRVDFSWNEERSVDGYEFVLARDKQFEDVVHEERVKTTHFTHGNLKAGHYYWKVHGLKGSARGPASRTGEIRLVRDEDPPKLNVEYPTGPVNASFLALSGVTEPGCRVFVADNQVKITETGAFESKLSLRRGVNVVVVESIDPAGNTSYRSELVDAQY